MTRSAGSGGGKLVFRPPENDPPRSYPDLSYPDFGPRRVDQQHRALGVSDGAWDAIEGRPDPEPHRRWGHVIAAGREANDAAKAVFYITKQLQRLLDRRLDRLMDPPRP